MPLYDWKCENCNKIFEAVASMSDYILENQCPDCGDGEDFTHASRLFSPNRNILIPGHFRLDRGWHLPPGGSETAGDASLNHRVQAKPKTSFRQEFDKNWRAIGGA